MAKTTSIDLLSVNGLSTNGRLYSLEISGTSNLHLDELDAALKQVQALAIKLSSAHLVK